VVTARDEADEIAQTLEALGRVFPAAPVVVADDGSRDATAQRARAFGAIVVSGSREGKGAAATRGCLHALELYGRKPVFVLCDADLGASAAQLVALRDAIGSGRGELAIGAFADRRGSGLGIALGVAHWCLRRSTGVRLRAPISGQRALAGTTLTELLPFAAGYGMELSMTIDALRAGKRIVELELELDHRRHGRGPAGFAHRARQLAEFLLACRRGRPQRSRRP